MIEGFSHGLRRRGSTPALVSALAAATLLAACHDKTAVEPAPPPIKAPATFPVVAPAAIALATPGLDPRERLARTVDLLGQGNEKQARAELTQLLQDRPNMREAKALEETLDTDPKTEFGSDSFAYQVGSRDSLITIAAAYLGDSYKFYGLARFNGIAVPNAVKPGDTIQIPGRPRSPIVRRPRREEGESRPVTAAPAPPPVEAPHTDPAQAQRLRRAGLERMSAGSIDGAVGLLSRAQQLDPANAAIAGDLARARRVQAAVHSRH